MSLHVFMLDIEMADRFGMVYEPNGRAMLASCVLLGWTLGMIGALPNGLTSRLFAFLLGGVMIISAHEEVSAEAGRTFWWFVGGASVYACVLLLI